ncbi:MAG: uncharacterized protein JWM82_3829 [Myxococcales bacterium]|nr:uncharacterized protein [Myxococcales bacterium]
MRVWVIDDKMKETEARTFVPQPHELAVSTHHDDDFSDRLKESWDLILVDENLGEEPGSTPTVFDGSSLVGWFRAEARRSGRQLPCVAIFTTQPDLFEKEVPAVGPAQPLGGSFVDREAYIAPVLDVEWLFAKDGADKAKIVKQIAALAHAHEAARTALGSNGASFDEFVSFLGLPGDATWRQAALSSLERARLPISEAATGGDTFRGPVSAVRWLLQDTLPFPGAFLSDTHVAARLGVTVASLDRLVSNPAEQWSQDLKRCVYEGPAAALFGRRWWAAGVADASLSVRIAVRAGENAQSAIKTLSGVENVAMLGDKDPVAVVDRKLLDAGIAGAASCVQLRPRGWPPQSEEPWMRIADAASAPWFRHMVDPSDQTLLDAATA